MFNSKSLLNKVPDYFKDQLNFGSTINNAGAEIYMSVVKDGVNGYTSTSIGHQGYINTTKLNSDDNIISTEYFTPEYYSRTIVDKYTSSELRQTAVDLKFNDESINPANLQKKEWFGTKAEFDAIATKVAGTDYHVTDEDEISTYMAAPDYINGSSNQLTISDWTGSPTERLTATKTAPYSGWCSVRFNLERSVGDTHIWGNITVNNKSVAMNTTEITNSVNSNYAQVYQTFPVTAGDVVTMNKYINGGTLNTSSDQFYLYWYPIKWVLTKGAIDIINRVNYPGKFIGQPDYSAVETINRLPAGVTSWTCDRDGHVQFTGASASSALRGAFYINGKSVYTPIPEARVENIIVPISKGDVASRNGDEYWLSSSIGSCYFIPPKPTAQLFVDGADLVSSDDIGKVKIDPETKTMEVNGNMSGFMCNPDYDKFNASTPSGGLFSSTTIANGTTLAAVYTVPQDGYVAPKIIASTTTADRRLLYYVNINGKSFYLRDGATGTFTVPLYANDIFPVSKGDTVQLGIYNTVAAITTLNITTSGVYFIPPKWIQVKNPVNKINSLVDLSGKWIGQPDYTKQESYNQIPTSNNSWTVLSDGYINIGSRINTGTGSTNYLSCNINGIAVFRNVERANAVSPDTIEDVLPVSKGDVVSLVSNGNEQWCYFIPPKSIPPIFVDADLQSSTALGKVSIDTDDKTMIVNGYQCTSPSLTATTTSPYKGKTRYLELGYNASWIDNSYTQFYKGSGAGAGSNNVLIFRLKEFYFSSGDPYVEWIIRVMVSQTGTVSSITASLDSVGSLLVGYPMVTVIAVQAGSDFTLLIAKGANYIARAIELIGYDEVSPNDDMVKLLNVIATPSVTSEFTTNGSYGKAASATGGVDAVYHISHPDTWPNNIEVIFGNGLYGKRRDSYQLGTCSLGVNASMSLNLSTLLATGMTSIINHGLWLSVTNNIDMNPLGSLPTASSAIVLDRCIHTLNGTSVMLTNRGSTALSGLAVNLRGWILYNK